jgi:sodium pump decarboxylase gamma subunit
MKKIISLTLAALILVTLLLTATSCELSMESVTGYTRLRDHVVDTVGNNGELELNGSALGFKSVKLIAPIMKDEDRANAVYLVAEGVSGQNLVRLTLTLVDSTEKATMGYQIISPIEQKRIVGADATVLLTHYTGNELLVFNTTEGIHPQTEQVYRESVTAMLNSALIVLDTYTTEHMDMSLRELGFIALSEKYMAPTNAPEADLEAEEDLGGAFSPARLRLAGQMIVVGVGMVFLVLAVLWIVLLIFKKVFYKDPAKADPKPAAPAPAPTAPAVQAAPAADNGALIAAITAAVAAYIESDPALSSQFAGGFRVVSFKPTSKNRNR